MAVASTANKDWNRTVDLLRTAGAISFEGYAWYRLVRYSRNLVDLPSDLTLAKSPNEPMKKYSFMGENQQSFFQSDYLRREKDIICLFILLKNLYMMEFAIDPIINCKNIQIHVLRPR